MGKWGRKLYDNDIAEDVKTEFLELLRSGLSTTQITEKMLKNNSEIIKNDTDDTAIFWLALADLQWKNGCLTDYVRKTANRHLTQLALNLRSNIDDPNGIIEPLIEYKELYHQLNSRMPSPQKIDGPKLFRCKWNIGDAYAYRIEGDFALRNGLFGRYLIFIKTGECVWFPGHIIPICIVKISSCNETPKTIEDIDLMESIQVSYSRMPNSSTRNTSTDYMDNYQKSYGASLPDGSIYLPHFQFQAITISSRSLPKKLQFLGNFTSIKLPYRIENEQKTLNMTAFSWNEIENRLLERYLWFNLKQASIFMPSSQP